MYFVMQKFPVKFFEGKRKNRFNLLKWNDIRQNKSVCMITLSNKGFKSKIHSPLGNVFECISSSNKFISFQSSNLKIYSATLQK